MRLIESFSVHVLLAMASITPSIADVVPAEAAVTVAPTLAPLISADDLERPTQEDSSEMSNVLERLTKKKPLSVSGTVANAIITAPPGGLISIEDLAAAESRYIQSPSSSLQPAVFLPAVPIQASPPSAYPPPAQTLQVVKKAGQRGEHSFSAVNTIDPLGTKSWGTYKTPPYGSQITHYPPWATLSANKKITTIMDIPLITETPHCNGNTKARFFKKGVLVEDSTALASQCPISIETPAVIIPTNVLIFNENGEIVEDGEAIMEDAVGSQWELACPMWGDFDMPGGGNEFNLPDYGTPFVAFTFAWARSYVDSMKYTLAAPTVGEYPSVVLPSSAIGNCNQSFVVGMPLRKGPLYSGMDRSTFLLTGTPAPVTLPSKPDFTTAPKNTWEPVREPVTKDNVPASAGYGIGPVPSSVIDPRAQEIKITPTPTVMSPERFIPGLKNVSGSKIVATPMITTLADVTSIEVVSTEVIPTELVFKEVFSMEVRSMEVIFTEIVSNIVPTSLPIMKTSAEIIRAPAIGNFKYGLPMEEIPQEIDPIPTPVICHLYWPPAKDVPQSLVEIFPQDFFPKDVPIPTMAFNKVVFSPFDLLIPPSDIVPIPTSIPAETIDTPIHAVDLEPSAAEFDWPNSSDSDSDSDSDSESESEPSRVSDEYIPLVEEEVPVAPPSRAIVGVTKGVLSSPASIVEVDTPVAELTDIVPPPINDIPTTKEEVIVAEEVVTVFGKVTTMFEGQILVSVTHTMTEDYSVISTTDKYLATTTEGPFAVPTEASYPDAYESKYGSDGLCKGSCSGDKLAPEDDGPCERTCGGCGAYEDGPCGCDCSGEYENEDEDGPCPCTECSRWPLASPFLAATPDDLRETYDYQPSTFRTEVVSQPPAMPTETIKPTSTGTITPTENTTPPFTSTVAAEEAVSTSIGPDGTMIMASSVSKEMKVTNGTDAPEMVKEEKEVVMEVSSGATDKRTGLLAVLVGVVTGLGLIGV